MPVARLLATSVMLLNCFVGLANTTNVLEINGSKIKTVFAKDAELTKTEIAQVTELAKQFGLTNAAAVATFYFLPGGGRGITIESVESHVGRNTRFDIVWVYELGWSGMLTNADTKFVGKFWADERGKISKLLREYKSTSGELFQVSIEQGVDVAMADTVVDLFINSKLQLSKNAEENKVYWRMLNRRGEVLPKSISKSSFGNDFELELKNHPTTVIKFKSENGKIIITGTSSYVI